MMTRRALTRAAAVTALSYSRILGASDRIGLGAIGLGVRGSYVMSLFQKNSDVEVRALCDVYGARIDRALETLHKPGLTANLPWFDYYDATRLSGFSGYALLRAGKAVRVLRQSLLAKKFLADRLGVVPWRGRVAAAQNTRELNH